MPGNRPRAALAIAVVLGGCASAPRRPALDPVAGTPHAEEVASTPGSTSAVAIASSSAPSLAASPAPIASGCRVVPATKELAVLDGRPYGVFPAGLRRLDRPNEAPALLGDAWPKMTPDAFTDRVVGVHGHWPDRLVAEMPRQKGDYATGDALFFDGKSWTVLPDPPGIVQYLQLFVAGRDRVVALGNGLQGTRVVALRGPGELPPPAGGTPVAACRGRGTAVWVTVSQAGRVALLRTDCEHRTRANFVAVERFDENLRSVGVTPFVGSTGIGSRSAIAWLDEESVLLGLRAESGGKDRLVKLGKGAATDLPLPAGDSVVSFTRTASGEQLVATRKHWFRLDATAKVQGAVSPWPASLLVGDREEAGVVRLVEGEDRAFYLELASLQGTLIVRCDRESMGP